MELEGTIVKCFELRSGTTERGNWMSQEFLLEHGTEQWKKKMVFTVFGEDRLKRFAIKEGQRVNVSFDIDAREWQEKWYPDIRAFDVRQRETSAPVAEAQEAVGGDAADDI